MKRILLLSALAALFISLSFFLNPVNAAELDPAEKARLEARLAEVEKEIAAQTKLLQGKQKETASIQRDVDILTAKIKRARLNIEAKSLEIKRLGGDINKKQETIVVLGEKSKKHAASLAEMIREVHALDSVSLTEAILSQNTMADVLNDISAIETMQNSLQQTYVQVKSTRVETEQQKVALEGRREAELSARKVIEQEKKTIELAEAEKKKLVALSKQQENSYKKVIAERELEKQAIRSALFKLRDTSNISFGQAYEYAKVVSARVGIRPAFLLAIITQESNLGQNVGTCNRIGDPVAKHWTNIMKPDRDIEPFKQITKELGISPEGRSLSCPIGGGWGGAMGPAQFIPSTWMMYKAKIAAVTGSNPPNPWNAQDAFAASGLYLAELGATGQTYATEHKAAARYYAGSRWSTAGQAYGNSVMNIAEGYQRNIDVLAK
ncbi:MAG TPA: lytic murein transglycosylase [Candidatus Paceibacterota bacterium]|nr:lytic murein transglycosylase [Candidatus Paceibacterota bacterium]